MAIHPLAGSERQLPIAARDIGPCPDHQRIQVSVLLRHPPDWAGCVASRMSGETPPLSRADYAARFSAAPDDIAAVERFAEAQGLAVIECDAARRTLRLEGQAGQFATAFGVNLREVETGQRQFRGREGPVRLPPGLVGVVEAVLGLDNRPQARSQHRLFRPAAATLTAFNPNQVADLYGIPASDGAGQTIAVIELGGGYVASDLATYFKGLGLTAPKVSAVLVDGAKNQPSGSANGPDGEVMLDIEVAGAVAPAASIVVYFAPNTDAGFLDALTSAVHDTIHKPTVISISWGGPESSWTAQAMTAFDQAMASAAMLGVTVCVASGDNGSGDGVGDGADHVDFPASSPHALACGGTRLTASGSAIASESVWNDGASGGAGGGGMSTQFAVPVWQKGLTAVTSSGARQPLGGRGVPDVAADADPATGYKVRVDGSDLVIGGTSAAAPLWAAIVARLQALAGKPIGPVQPSLYADPAACNDITSGDNGDFAATAGWDACTGLGSPHGAGLKKAFGL